MPAGGAQWRNCPVSEFNEQLTTPTRAGDTDHAEIVKFITNASAW
jgi:hypothetical protein